jgi:hypothetical protein
LIDHARDFVSVPVGTVDAIPGSGNDWLSLTQPPPAANVAELATVKYANVPRGQSVYVSSRFRCYVSVPVGNGDGAGTGNDWKSDPSTSSPGQQTLAAWFIDPAGSDDNNGTNIATPLATLKELQSRWGNNPVLVSTVVKLANGNYGANQQSLNFSVSTSTTVVEITGTPSAPLASDTVGTFTAPSTVTNRGYLITGTLLGDFTPYVGKRIRFTVSGAVCFVLLANPFGLGVGTAEITQPQNEPVAPNYTSASFAPAAGNAFVVEDLPVIGRLTIISSSAPTQVTDPTFKNVPSVVIKSINAPFCNCSMNGAETAGVRLWGSLFNSLGISTPWVNSVTVNASLFMLTDFQLCVGNYAGCGFKTALLNPVTNVQLPAFTQLTTCYFEGIGCVVSYGGAFFFNCGIFNASTVDGITVNAQADLTVVSGFLLGSGNARGITVAGGVKMNKIGGFANMKITGTAGDWRFGTGPIFAWADAPRAQNYGSFSGVLGAGGTVNVPVTNLPADANAWATARVLAGAGATGLLRIPAQTTAQVTVTAAVATETSTFAGGWISPSSPAGGMFAT